MEPTSFSALDHPEAFAALQRLTAAMLPPTRLSALLAAVPDPAAALDPPLQSGLTARQRERVRREAATALCPEPMATARALGATALLQTDPAYPRLLAALPDAPPILFVVGTLPAVDPPGLAIVGSRRATSYGRAQAVRFARALVARGVPVISGGAAGIDTAAHQAALDAGGSTVAVVACGLDRIYPAQNRTLFARIAAGGGALVSEYAFGTPPEPWRFPARNRIIAGIARATIVIESPDDSGAMITARNACEYGRDVWAVPGPVDLGRSRGCHRLIQDGAYLADRPEDVLDAVPLEAGAAVQTALALAEPELALSGDEAALLDHLGASARHLDELAQRAGLAAARAGVAATMLEMKGLLRRQPGSYFTRA